LVLLIIIFDLPPLFPREMVVAFFTGGAGGWVLLATSGAGEESSQV
jgi:hypothetical protein